jgi:hypothetical protein
VHEAIKSAFREMVRDMEAQDIAIKELTEQRPAFTEKLLSACTCIETLDLRLLLR